MSFRYEKPIEAGIKQVYQKAEEKKSDDTV